MEGSKDSHTSRSIGDGIFWSLMNLGGLVNLRSLEVILSMSLKKVHDDF